MAVNKQGKHQKGKPKKRRRSFFRSFYNGAKTVVLAVNRYTTRTDTRTTSRPIQLFGRRLTFIGFMALVFALLFLIVLAMNDRAVNANRESIIVTGLPDDFEGYRILHISDLNGKSFGQDQSTLMRIIGNLSYDCVVFTGDMIGKSGNAEPFYTLLDELGTRKPVYFIPGDSDPAPLLDKARDNSSQTLTLNQMVLNDWVLGAIERGAIYVNTPQKITKGASSMWLMPDMLLNLNVTQTMDALKDEVEQETESMHMGVTASRESLPFTNYRYNIMNKCASLISGISPQDLLVTLSHEVPTDSQIAISQDSRTQQQLKSYYPSPDLVLAGHFCGGEWKVPGLGAFFISSRLSPRFGWFPNQKYVEGQRSVGSTIIYVTPGLSTSGDTLLSFRLMNPPRVSLITLTGELPTSFLD